MNQTAQTWALVGATLGAVVITFIGTSYQQRKQAEREARVRYERVIAELLSAALDSPRRCAGAP